jgi:hypothetical protein
MSEDMVVVVLVGNRIGITTLASGNPRRVRIALGFCWRPGPGLSSAPTVALTTAFRLDWSADSWRVFVATGGLEPRKAPSFGAVTDANSSWGFRSSRLESYMSSFQTTLLGLLIHRLRRGVAATKAAAASGDVHEHQRHKGINIFEKPHCRQMNRGRWAGTNSSCGNEVDFGRC